MRSQSSIWLGCFRAPRSFVFFVAVHVSLRMSNTLSFVNTVTSAGPSCHVGCFTWVALQVLIGDLRAKTSERWCTAIFFDRKASATTNTPTQALISNKRSFAVVDWCKRQV